MASTMADLSLTEETRSRRPSTIDNKVLRSISEQNWHLQLEKVQNSSASLIQLLVITYNLIEYAYHISLDTMWCRFSTGWLLEKKSGLFTRMLREEKITANQENCQQLLQNQIFIKKGFGGKMSCFWWEIKDPVYYVVLLNQEQTFNADLHCNQLDQLHAALWQIRPVWSCRKDIIFPEVNDHTAMVTQQKLVFLGNA